MKSKMKTVGSIFTATGLMLGGIAFADTPMSPPTPSGANANQGQPLTPADTTTSGKMAMQNAADQTVSQQLAMIAQAGPSAPDKLFTLEAACGNMWEVEFGKLVASRTDDDKIKELATMMVTDHQAANEALKPIAQSEGLTLPDGLSSDKQAKLNIFRSLSVEQLNHCYLGMMKADHAKDVIEYADHAKSAQNEQVKKYAADTLPKLKEHARHVNELAMSKGISDEGSKMMDGMREKTKEMKDMPNMK